MPLEYKNVMCNNLRRNMPKITKSISNAHFKDLLSNAQSKGWLFPVAVQQIECTLDREGVIRASEKFFEEFISRKKFIPALCEYLWESEHDETAEFIDVERRCKRADNPTAQGEQFVSTSCEAVDAKTSKSDPNLVSSDSRLIGDRAGIQIFLIHQELGECINNDDELMVVKSYALKVFEKDCSPNDIRKTKSWKELCEKINHLCAWNKSDAIGLRQLVESVKIFEKKKPSLLEKIEELERMQE